MVISNNTKQSKSENLADNLLAVQRLTIVTAPTGFGKTDLLMALERKAQDLGFDKITYVDRRTHYTDPRLAAHHVSECSLKENTRTLILIDDADDCDGRSLSAALDKTDFLRRDLRVVVAMRRPEAISFARLVASNEANVVTTEALQLSTKEQTDLLKTIPKPWKARIGEMAGRWPVAMKLLRDWVSTHSSSDLAMHSNLIHRQSGLYSLIDEQVIQGLQDNQLAALKHISLFEAPSIDTIRKIFPEYAFDTIIADLLHTHSGLIELDSDSIVINPAFRFHLIDCFQQAGSDEFEAAASSSVHYLAGVGDLSAAANLASLSRKPDQIDQIVAQNGNLRIWLVQGFQVVRNIVDAAGENALEQYPRLKLMSAIVHLKEGRIRSAEDVYWELEKSSSQWPDMTTDLEVLRITLLVYGCSLEREGELQTFSEITQSAEEDSTWKTLLSTLSCLLHSQRGQLEQAKSNLNEARIQAGLADSDYNIMFSYVHETGIHLAQGKLKQARTSLTKARKLWRNQFVDDEGVDTVISALSASVEYESGRLTSARNAVRRSARRFPHSEAWFDIYVAAYEPMIRLVSQDRGLESAIALIEDQKQLLERQGLSRVARMLEGLRIILSSEQNLKEGKLAQIITKDDLNVQPSSTWQETETYTLAKAYIAIGEGKIDNAVGLLERENGRVTKLQLKRSQVRFLIVLSICYLTQNQSQLAEERLLKAINLGATSGSVQILREFAHHRDLYQCLASLRTHVALDRSQQAFVDKILSNGLKESRKLDSIVSEREVEILAKLGDGGSDKFIARQLGLSEHGVRYHLKNIYRKLAVHDRTSAVAAASAQELI